MHSERKSANNDILLFKEKLQLPFTSIAHIPLKTPM